MIQRMKTVWQYVFMIGTVFALITTCGCHQRHIDLENTYQIGYIFRPNHSTILSGEELCLFEQISEYEETGSNAYTVFEPYEESNNKIFRFGLYFRDSAEPNRLFYKTLGLVSSKEKGVPLAYSFFGMTGAKWDLDFLDYDFMMTCCGRSDVLLETKILELPSNLEWPSSERYEYLWKRYPDILPREDSYLFVFESSDYKFLFDRRNHLVFILIPVFSGCYEPRLLNNNAEIEHFGRPVERLISLFEKYILKLT